jgi:aromatic-amino-acid transaminase
MTDRPADVSSPGSPLAAAARALRANDSIFRMHFAARDRRAAGADVIDATLGALIDDEGRLAVLASADRAFREASGPETAGYSPLSGRADLIEAIRRDCLPTDLVDESTAVVTPGGTGAIHQAVVNFLDPGEAALTTSYFWGPYGMITERAGRRLERFETFAEGGGLDVAAFARALDELADRQERVLVLLNTPGQNPTGYTFTAEEWDAIADAVASASARSAITVLVDLAYLRFAVGAPDPWPALRRILDHGPLLMAWTASKTYTRYGARIGGLVSVTRDDDLRTEITRVMDLTARGTWTACNHAGQLAVQRLLTDPHLAAEADRERAELLQLLVARHAAFAEAAAALGLPTVPWGGGFFTAVPTPDAADVAERLTGEDVFVVPLQGALRIALCAVPAAQMGRLAEGLARSR